MSPPPLRVSAWPDLARICAEGFAPATERPQLDLFQDNRALVLEQDIVRALTERRPDAALRAVRDLTILDPDHRRLADYLHLIQILDQCPGPLNPEARLRELDAVGPLAERLLRHRARDLLAPLWAALGGALADRAFDAAAPRLHAAPSLARAGDWGGARAAVEAQPDWRRHPDLILIHAEACRRTHDAAAARRDWVGLCWDHPRAAQDALDAAGLADWHLADLWGRLETWSRPWRPETSRFGCWSLTRVPLPPYRWGSLQQGPWGMS